jgi:hypothetical protein
MKLDNLTKYTCDVCGKTEYVSAKEPSPMQEIRLPMKYYDETGRAQRLSNQRVDMCSNCFEALEKDLSKHYDMRCIAYIGVEIKRLPTEKGGVQE